MKTSLIKVTDNRVLKQLANAGLIVWPVMVNNSKGIKFKYVDEIDNKYSFIHKGKEYITKYESGCFYPYLFEVLKTPEVKVDTTTYKSFTLITRN